MPTGHQSGMVAYPDRVRLKKDYLYLLRLKSFGPASASPFIFGWYFLTRLSTAHSRFTLRFLSKQTCIIGLVSSLSDYAIYHRWRSPPRIRRHKAGSPQGSTVSGDCLFRYGNPHRTNHGMSPFTLTHKILLVH